VRLAAVLLATVAFLAASASAAYQPKRYIARYCSQTGDLCYGIFGLRSNNRIIFQITTQELYFRRYRLCVEEPTGAVRCRNLPINRQTPVYGSLVYWRRNFGDHGPGVYRVTWSLSGRRLGPTLSFRRR
jgi:hypothetical protein